MHLCWVTSSHERTEEEGQSLGGRTRGKAQGQEGSEGWGHA